MLKIELKFKDKTLKHIQTDKSEITIGRGANNDIQIDNLSVSNNHAKLVKESGTYQVEDLNSTNGTLVNSVDTRKTVLCNNDVISVGHHDLRIENVPPVNEDMAEKIRRADTVTLEDPEDVRRSRALHIIRRSSSGTELKSPSDTSSSSEPEMFSESTSQQRREKHSTGN